MVDRTRLGLYLKDAETKRQIKVAAAKRGMTTTAYCARAIEERLIRDGERNTKEVDKKTAFLSRMDKLRLEISPVGLSVATIVPTLGPNKDC